MAIKAYVGKPGAGKSYGALLHVIMPALKAGRTVYTNMVLDKEKLIKACGGKGFIIDFDAKAVNSTQLCEKCPPGAVAVIDEPYRYWPGGMKANAMPEIEREFFAMHRHRVGEDGFATEIALVVQSLSNISSFIRELVDQTFVITKLNALGFNAGYRVDCYGGAVSGENPNIKNRLSEGYGVYRKKNYQFYKSHTQSLTGASGLEMNPDKRGNVFHSFKLWAAVVALMILPWPLLGVWHFFHPVHASESVAAERSGAPQTQRQAQGPQLPPVPAAPQWSTAWRLAGRIKVGLEDYYVADGDHGARKVDRHACKTDSGLNVICTVDGQLVAFWTGPKAGFMESALGRTTAGVDVAAP